MRYENSYVLNRHQKIWLLDSYYKAKMQGMKFGNYTKKSGVYIVLGQRWNSNLRDQQTFLTEFALFNFTYIVWNQGKMKVFSFLVTKRYMPLTFDLNIVHEAYDPSHSIPLFSAQMSYSLVMPKDQSSLFLAFQFT